MRAEGDGSSSLIQLASRSHPLLSSALASVPLCPSVRPSVRLRLFACCSGYTGFVRGSQHISGRTFGETSRRALCTDYREVVSSSPIPSAPQANRKIRHEDLRDTFVANMFGGKTYQIPGVSVFCDWGDRTEGREGKPESQRAGECSVDPRAPPPAQSAPLILLLTPPSSEFAAAVSPVPVPVPAPSLLPQYTGFVPGVRSTYAKRYGSATEQEMLAHSIRFPRRDNQSNAFARTQLPREHYPVSSAPLPGGAVSQAPPEMYIPEHVRSVGLFCASTAAAHPAAARDERLPRALEFGSAPLCSPIAAADFYPFFFLSRAFRLCRYLKFFPQ